jgi:hypothetical protein
LFAAAAVGALALLRIALWRPLAVKGDEPADGYTRVTGVVHVHTTLSDGGGTPDEVVAAAQRAGLGFLAITDHNNLEAKPVEGYHGGVLVLVGSELSTTAGHLLGLGIRDPVYRFSGGARDGLEDIRDLGGAAFAAHPTSPRDDFRWTGWDLPGPWGLELLNGDSEWRRASWGRLARLGGLYLLNPRYALLSGLTAPTEALGRWDGLLAHRDVAGIVGADAHSRAPLTRNRAVRLPSYEALFALARNHVVLPAPLSGDAAKDGLAIVEALSNGHTYVSLDALAPADAISFTAESEGRHWTMGETVPAGPEVRLRAGGRMPAGTRLLLLRDGQRLLESAPPLTAKVPGPGVYRVEARVPGWEVPWVVTNPIYVFDRVEQGARLERASWPAPAAVPKTALLLDDFEGKTLFEPGHDPSSRLDDPLLDPLGGLGGTGAARLRFRLAAPSATQPYPFVAMIERGARDLSGYRGLVFSVRADGVYRFWVQVRDENKASLDEGTEWWFASIRSSGDWQRVAVPFTSLRSINPNTDRRLDLDKVRAIVFVLDRGTTRGGQEGTIWIDNLGFY